MSKQPPAARDFEGWRDAACFLFLLAATWHLAGVDGGKPIRSLLPALLLALPVLAATLRELARSSCVVRWIVAGWTLGPLVALVAAGVRAGWVRPVAALALAVPAFLAARHLWRRPWGPAALGGVVAAAGARAWGEAFLAFWGGAGGNAWLALSWHNQSATLMGAMALLGFGLAAGGRGWVRVLGFVLAGAGGGATWHAASRAGLVMAFVGLGVGAIVALRRRPPRRVGEAFAGTVILSLVATLALGSLASAPGSGVERMLERGLDRGNLDVRFAYWKGAWGMVRQAPFTGTGPGSYRWASLPHASFGAPRSASAHNEYLETLGGHGIIGGGAVWAAGLAGAWLVLGALLGRGSGSAAGEGNAPRAPAGGPGAGGPGARRDPERISGSAGRAGVIAAAGVLALLGLHAGFDFDWDYPLLLVAAAVALAVLSIGDGGRERQMAPARGGSSALALLGVSAAGLLVAVSLWGIGQETRLGGAPWELDRRAYEAVSAATGGEPERARRLVAGIERWNPGAPTLPAIRAVVEHASGALDDEGLMAQSFSAPSIDDRLLIAERLVAAGAPEHAGRVLDALRPFLEERERWQVRVRVARFVGISLALALEAGGCEAVADAWEGERAWAETLRVPPELLREHVFAPAGAGTRGGPGAVGSVLREGVGDSVACLVGGAL